MIADKIRAAMERDPAVSGFWGVLEVIITYAGFHALLLHDLAHFLHAKLHMPLIPKMISQLARWLTGIEIHPGAKISRNVFIDHGMGVVIGETAEVGEGSTLFQGVTLGGTGKERGKRHPTLGKNVVVGVGAAILGNITIGDNSYIGAGAVVVRSVPPNSTAVGVPARIVKMEGEEVIGASLDHANLPDPILERLQALAEEVERAEQMIEGESALPHITLSVPTHDVDHTREIVEHIMSRHHASYNVREVENALRIATTLNCRTYFKIKKELDDAGMNVSTEIAGTIKEGETRSFLISEAMCDEQPIIHLTVVISQLVWVI